MHDDPLVVACDRYLESKRCQLWGQFSISRVEDRWDAACWLAEQVRGLFGELWEAPDRRHSSDHLDEGRWERGVLDKPGAAERVTEIEGELRAGSGFDPEEAR